MAPPMTAPLMVVAATRSERAGETPTLFQPRAISDSPYADQLLALFITSVDTHSGLSVSKSPNRNVFGGAAIGATGSTATGACSVAS